MVVDPTTTKYLIKANIKADGVIEKPDVVGAIFGQTEGLLGNELDLRDLQKSARIGRIEVKIDAKKGKSEGEILLPSSMDKVETAILGAALESIDRVGPCKASIRVQSVEDVRVVRRTQVIDRAKELLANLVEDSKGDSADITGEVKTAVQVAEITRFGPERLPAGPNVGRADAIILVEGRNDVLNLLKNGIKNALAVEGTNIPKSVQDKTRECVTTAFVDGDRGGELILRELFQTCEIDFVARAPKTREVEEIPHKLIMKALKNKIPAEQFAQMANIPFKKTDSKDAATLERVADGDLGQESSEPKGGARKKAAKKKSSSRRRDRSDDDKPASRDSRSKAPEPTPKELSPQQEAFRERLEGLKGSLKAVLLDADGKEVEKDVAVRELAEKLKGAKDGGVDSVVFDGVITQRLLDIAAEKKVKAVVGAKIGNVAKAPESVKVLSRDDL